MRRSSAIVALIPLLVGIGCEAPDTADTGAEGAAEMPGAPAVDVAAIEAEVDQIRSDWIAAAERDDAAAVAALYADDAVVVGPAGQPAQGRQAIQEAFAADFPQATNLQVTSSDVEVSGDLVTDMGEFTQTVQTPDGQQQTVTGRYIVVLRRQADGAWRIVQHLSAVPMPAEGAATM